MNGSIPIFKKYRSCLSCKLSTLFLLLLTMNLAVAQVTLPVSRIVYQRDNTNHARISVQGICPVGSQTIQAKATALNGGQSTDWTTVTSTTTGFYSGILDLTGGWYQLDVRAMSGTSQTGYWTVDRVGVGEVLLVAGQSNAQGSSDGPDANDDRVSCVDAVNGEIREYQLQFKFRHLDGSASVGPTNNKHFYGALGDQLVHRLNVPVLLLGAAIGGTSSNQYAVSARGDFSTPDAQNWDPQQEMKPYRAIGSTINHYVRRTGLRGILWFQGESDNGMVSGDTYYNNIATVINKTRSDLGYPIAWVISQTSYIAGVTDGAITNAQTRLASMVSNCFLGPNTDAYGAAFRDADNTHFASSQKELLATIWNNALSNSFFSQSSFTLTDAPATVTTGLPVPARQYAGGHIYVGYVTSGNTIGASYSVQLLDGNGNYLANLGTASSNPIRVFLPDNLGAGRYRVKVVSSAGGNVSTPSDQFEVFDRGYSKGSGTGLTGVYYPNDNFAGSAVINRVDGPLDYTWVSPPSSAMPADNRNWTARWTGQVEAPVSGQYTIKVMNDDGSRVYINNQLVIDDWTVHPWANVKYGTIYLEGGKKYDIKVELYQAWFDAQVRVYWALPGRTIAEYIPIDRLYTTNANPITPPAQAPVLSGNFSPLSLTVNQAVQLNLPASFTDPGNLALSYSYQGLPAGISATGLTLSGNPTTAGSGQFTITARNSANLTASATVAYQVSNSSTPIASGNCGFSEGQYLFTTSWGEAIYAHFYKGVLFAAYRDGSSFRPQHWLAVAIGGTGFDPNSISCFAENDPHTTPTTGPVLATNRAPVVVNTPTLSAGTQNSAYSATIPASTFSDPDGDLLTYSITGLTAGLTASGLTISGTPTSAGTASLTIRVTDPKGLYTETTVSLLINPSSGSTSTTPPANPLNGSYEGFVDGKSCSSIFGWVYNRNAANDAVTIEVLSGNQVIFSYLASSFRQDLVNAGKGNGYHAYSFPTPIALQTGSAVNVTVRVKNAGYVLTNAPFTLTCPAVVYTPSTNRAPLVATLPTLPPGTQNNAYSATIPASTFSDPDGDVLTYTLTGLPAGLSATGLTISGTPTTAATSTLTLRATDPSGLFVETTTSLLINAASGPTTTTPPSNPLNGRYEGYVDWNNCSALGGWVYNGNAPNEAVTLELVNNGQVLATTLAQTYRGDLVSAGKGNGYHGYQFTVPTSVKTGSPVTLSVRVKNAGYVLTNAPFTLTCPNGSRLVAHPEEEVATTFTAYPNPTRDRLRINVPTRYQASAVTLTLIELSGRTQELAVTPIDGQTYATDLGTCSPGLYLIRVEADGKPVTTLKVLKQ